MKTILDGISSSTYGFEEQKKHIKRGRGKNVFHALI